MNIEKHQIFNYAARTAVLTAVLMLAAVSVFAQEPPPAFRQLPCPDTGQKLYQTSADFFDLPWVKNAPLQTYVARCYYENGGLIAYWSSNPALKEQLCNDPDFIKGNSVSGRYNLIDKSIPRGSAFWFLFDRDHLKQTLRVMHVFEGANAYQAGLRPGNEIIALDGLSVSKFSNDELQEFFKSRNEVVFRVNDKENMIYKDIKITKVEHDPFQKSFDLFSTVNYAHVSYSYDNRKGTEQQDYDLWHAKAMEFLKKFENEGLVCRNLDISEKGPVAE